MWVIGNWKMNGAKSELLTEMETLWGHISNEWDRHPKAEVQVRICPPFPYLGLLEQIVKDKGFSELGLAAQDLSQFVEDGAYTGETNGRILRDCGVTAVLVGHSERRTIFSEDDQVRIPNKIRAAVEGGLTPVICLGEPEAVRLNDEYFDYVGRQLDSALRVMAGFAFKPFFMVAYEPIWAIGTGQVAEPQTVQAMHQFIKRRIKEFVLDGYKSATVPSVPVLYGGSVNADNAESLLRLPDVNGVLVGGASRNMLAFSKIIQAAFRVQAGSGDF